MTQIIHLVNHSVNARLWVLPEPPRRPRIRFLLSQLGAYAADLFAEQTTRLGITPSEAGVIRAIGRNQGVTSGSSRSA